MTTLTCSARQLREWDACPEQVEKVVAEWGEGEFAVTRATLMRAAALGLDIGWWLSHAGKALGDDYEAKRKLLGDDYWAKRKLLDDDYEAKCEALMADVLGLA